MPAGNVIHEFKLEIVQTQSLMVVIVTVLVVAEKAAVSFAGAMEKVQGVPDCVTRNDLPPMTNVPERESELEFSMTE